MFPFYFVPFVVWSQDFFPDYKNKEFWNNGYFKKENNYPHVKKKNLDVKGKNLSKINKYMHEQLSRTNHYLQIHTLSMKLMFNIESVALYSC